MSKTTKIEWASSTGSPWIGCTKVSPGCKNCYAAELDAQRFSRTMGGGTKAAPVSHWGKGAPRFRTKGFWKDAVRWNQLSPLICPKCSRELTKPLGPGTCGTSIAFNPHKKEHTFCDGIPYRKRIFPSLCDWLDHEVPIEWLTDFCKLIHDCPNLDFLMLTKRIENFFPLLEAAWKSQIGQTQAFLDWIRKWGMDGKPPANCWLGVSVEDRPRKDRIDLLRNIPAKVRFLSLEPLLEDLGELDLTGIHWVIVGGESGKGARPCNVEWIRSVLEQCKAAGVPCFVKQLGAKPQHRVGSDLDAWTDDLKLKDPKGGDPSEWSEDLRVRQFPTQ